MSLERISEILIDNSCFPNEKYSNSTSPNPKSLLKKSIGKPKKKSASKVNKNLRKKRRQFNLKSSNHQASKLKSFQKMISRSKRFYDQPPTPHNTTQYIMNAYDHPNDLSVEDYKENQYSDCFCSMKGILAQLKKKKLLKDSYPKKGLFDWEKKFERLSSSGSISSKSTCSDSEIDNQVKSAKFEKNPQVLLGIIESLKIKNKQKEEELMDLERLLTDS